MRLSAINTINSITGIDLDTLEPRPNVDGKSSHGGYCGPAVKPIALNMVQQVMSDPLAALPMSGIGGIGSWQDAAEFILLGAGTVQVCTAAMHYGYRIVEDMGDGLLSWMRRKGYETIDDFRGLSLPKMRDWKHLNLNFRVVARDPCGQVHRLPALLHGVLGWSAPVHSSRPHGRRHGAGGKGNGSALRTA